MLSFVILASFFWVVSILGHLWGYSIVFVHSQDVS